LDNGSVLTDLPLDFFLVAFGDGSVNCACCLHHGCHIPVAAFRELSVFEESNDVDVVEVSS
jgi:hypothetical protein